MTAMRPSPTKIIDVFWAYLAHPPLSSRAKLHFYGVAHQDRDGPGKIGASALTVQMALLMMP